MDMIQRVIFIYDYYDYGLPRQFRIRSTSSQRRPNRKHPQAMLGGVFFLFSQLPRRWKFCVDIRRPRKSLRAVLFRTVSKLLPQGNAVDALNLHLLDLEEVQLDGSLPSKHRHQDLHLT